MSVLVGLIYLALCAGLAWLALSRCSVASPWLRATLGQSLFWLFFLAPFLLLAASDLLLATRRVSVPWALVVLLAAAVPLRALLTPWHRWKTHDSPGWTWRGLSVVPAWWGLGLLLIAVAALLPTGFPRGFEATAYHLPLAVEMIKTGTLRVWGEAYMHMFPANASIVLGFLISSFGERWAVYGSLVFLPLLATSVAAIAQHLNSREWTYPVVAGGVLSVPIVCFSAVETGADIGGLALTAAAIALVMTRYANEWSRALFLGAVLGLAFGFKSLHLITAGVVGLLFLEMALAERHRYPRLLGIVGHAGCIGGGFLVVAGFWLLRNYLQLGNPLYPVYLGFFEYLGWTRPPDVGLVGRAETQFEWVRSVSEWWVYPWVEWHYIGQYFKHSSGVGAFFAVGIIPAVVYAILARFVVNYRRDGDGDAFRLALGFVVVLSIWAGMGDRQPRYAMASIAFGAPLVAWLLTELSVAGIQRWGRMALIGSVVLMLGVFGTRELLHFGDRVVLSEGWKRHRFYDYPRAIDALPEDSVVINGVGRVWNYALYGAGLRNNIVSATAAEGFRERLASAAPEACSRPIFLFVQGKAGASWNDVGNLDMVAKLERNPLTGVALPEPRSLYRIDCA